MHGRDPGPRALDALLDRALARTGGCLLVTAPPGGGRSALAHRAARAMAAAGGRVVTAPGHAAETGLPYAALTLLTARLTAPGTPAVPAVLGAAATHPAAPQARVPDSAADLARCLLDLLGAAARHRPLLLVVDDVQHWDAPSRTVLGLAARRLGPHCPAALLLTADTHHGTAPDRPDASGRPAPADHFAGLPHLALGPLTDSAAAELVSDTAPGPVAPAVLAALVDAAHGRPGMLAELLAALTPPQLSGLEALPAPLPATVLLRRYTGRLALLPTAEQARLLTLAVAEEAAEFWPGEPRLPSATGQGEAGPERTGPEGLTVAARAGIVAEHPDGPRFTDPLWPVAVRQRASAADRRAAHRRLAADTAGTGPHLVHLWHTASAAPAPDPAAADALAAAARHASAPDAGVTVLPGGLAALLALAAELGPQSALAADRYARAAEQAWLAGRTGLARQLLDRARRLPADRPTTGRATRTTGLVELAEGSAAQARATLALAAGLLSPADPDLALDARRHAAEAAWAAGDLAGCRAETAALLPQPGTVGTGATAVPAVLLPSACRTAAAFDRHYSRGIPALRRTVADAAPEHETESTVENGSAAAAQALAAAAALGGAAGG
ncbi:AAA family ATPase, partial [Kitasatospora arboriphila]